MSTDNHAHAANDPSHMHHFQSADHQFVTTKQGVWVFMLSEILMFGGLFVAYFIFHNKFPETFHEGSQMLDWKLGAVNTVVLLLSSYTMANAIHQLQSGKSKLASTNLWITFFCAMAFMVVKYIEYSHKFHVGTLPGKFFNITEHADHVVQNANLAMFYSFYFVMTGLHGIHVLVGMGMIFWMIRRVNRGYYNSHYYTGVEGVGLYWHVVDLVWIYLFPLLYLVG